MLTLHQHIELRGENPLQAVIAGTEIEAALVANLYRREEGDMKRVLDQYDLTPAQVHAALTFYYDNREVIEAAFDNADKRAAEIGTPADDGLETLRRR